MELMEARKESLFIEKLKQYKVNTTWVFKGIIFFRQNGTAYCEFPHRSTYL